jgi:CrcB protein
MVQSVEALLVYEPETLLRGGQEVSLPSPFFCHDFRSDLEDYAEVLEKLGLLEALVDPPGSACCFRLICSSDEAALIAFEKAPVGPSLPRMLASLLYFASGEYGMTEEIGAVFPLDCRLQEIMPDMCDLGYAERVDQGYRWTSKFQEILQIMHTQVVISIARPAIPSLMLIFLLVFLGAGLGGVLRHSVNLLCGRYCGVDFPWGTFAINISGSLIMGLIAGYLAFKAGEAWTQHARLFLMTGILGGYTTFSAFSLDAVLLWERGQVGTASFYVLGSVGFAIAGLVAGLTIVRALT